MLMNTFLANYNLLPMDCPALGDIVAHLKVSEATTQILTGAQRAGFKEDMKKRTEEPSKAVLIGRTCGAVLLAAYLLGYAAPVRAEDGAEGGRTAGGIDSKSSTNTSQRNDMVLSRAPGIAMLAGGGAFLVTAVITGSLALSQSNDLEDKCPGNYCFPPQHEDVDRLNALATVTDVFIPLSVVLLISGTSVYIASRQMERKYGNKKTASLKDSPMQRLSFSGSSLTWRF